jgi:hypothetical protein
MWLLSHSDPALEKRLPTGMTVLLTDPMLLLRGFDFLRQPFAGLRRKPEGFRPNMRHQVARALRFRQVTRRR